MSRTSQNAHTSKGSARLGVVRPLAKLLVAASCLVVLWRPGPALAFTDAQAKSGSETFQLQCARCHGPNGEGLENIYHGLRAPELIGPKAFPVDPRAYQKLRHFDFHSVRDIYEFASASMPADQPASLSADVYWDVIAYLLEANGVRPDSKQLDETSAAEIPIPLMQRQGMPPRSANAGQ
ncbi:MAG: c-type cytochrome [Candidatus Binataceae bacterium]|jgi:cytochrome c